MIQYIQFSGRKRSVSHFIESPDFGFGPQFQQTTFQTKRGIALKPWSHWARVLLTAGAGLFIVLIFLNSSLPAAQSSTVSGGVVEEINALLKEADLSWEVTDHMVRKTAHFLEFMGLGILVFLAIRSYTPHPACHLFTGLFVGLMVPVSDESIQLFVEGRSGQVSDVVLDFTGFVTGTLLFFLLFFLFTRKKRCAFSWKPPAS